jgi:16S rRNA (adenine1518-N6/adenine1519-N6)-dimethyltransferase
MKPKKYFGQHFLHEQNVIAKIIAAIQPHTNEHFLEIGPGRGALTTHLLPIVKTMDVVEIDRDIIPLLQEACQSLGTLHIYQQDILKFDFATIDEKRDHLRVVGNLPYNISTPLLFHLLKNVNLIQDMHFMLQKEVAQRIVAQPGSKIYGRLSVMLQYYCEAKLLFTVSSGAFVPAPKVDSAFIRLIPKSESAMLAQSSELLSEIVRVAFNQRRKTIGKTLQRFIAPATMRDLGIDPQARPEELSVEKFVTLCNNAREH